MIMKKWIVNIFCYIRKIYYKIVKKCIFKNGSYFNRKTCLAGYNCIGENTRLYHTYLGEGSYVANDSRLAYVKIGKYSSISQGVMTVIGRHPTNDFVSTHPAFYALYPWNGHTFAKQQLFEEYPVKFGSEFIISVGNDVWIGGGVLILDGVRIGDGAIIGAGAVVTKDIPPYAVAVGVPAKVIKYRFSKEEILFLKEIKWWDWDMKRLKENADIFKNISEFIENQKLLLKNHDVIDK